MDDSRKPSLDYIAKTWGQWLSPLVPDLPPFKLVIDDLKQKIYKLFLGLIGADTYFY